MSEHRCPAPGCERRIKVTLFACLDHWFQLPKDIRDAIWGAYRTKDTAWHAATAATAQEWWRANL